MTVTFLALLISILCARYASTGFDFSKTFEHMSPLAVIAVAFCVPFISMSFAFLISLWFRLATITISAGAIHGRSYWGRKYRIPLNDINKLCPFSHNGIKAIVVHSNYHGQIYISDKTQRLPELLDFLAGYLPDS